MFFNCKCLQWMGWLSSCGAERRHPFLKLDSGGVWNALKEEKTSCMFDKCRVVSNALEREAAMAKTDQKKQVWDLSEAEWDILRVVWENDPCAAGTVQESLADSRQWAYSTVKTMMDRMVAKGLLGMTKIRNLQLFTATITPAEAKRREVKRTLKRAFDGALTPLVQFLVEQDEFSQDDIQALRGIVKQAEKKRK